MANIDNTLHNILFSDNKIDYSKMPLIYVLKYIRSNYEDTVLEVTRNTNFVLTQLIPGFFAISVPIFIGIGLILIACLHEAKLIGFEYSLLVLAPFVYISFIFVLICVVSTHYGNLIRNTGKKKLLSQLTNNFSFKSVPELSETRIVKIFDGITQSTVIMDEDESKCYANTTSKILELYKKKYETYYLKKIDDDNYCIVRAIYNFLTVEEKLYSKRISADKIITLLSDHDKYDMSINKFNMLL